MEHGLEIIIKPEYLFNFLGLPITNTLLASFLAAIFLIVCGLLLGRRIYRKPKGVQNLLEMIIDSVLGLIEEVLEDKKLALKVLPLVLTIFLFILTANWMEFIPGVGSIKFFNGEYSVPLLRSVNTDLNVTIALAMVSVIVIEILGFVFLGIKNYGKKFINFSGPVGFLVGLIEMLSESARLISFSFRLFGNIFAGEVLILVMTYFMPVFLPVPFMLFEIFVGILQAAIFAGLTLIFIKVAITHHEEGAH